MLPISFDYAAEPAPIVKYLHARDRSQCGGERRTISAVRRITKPGSTVPRPYTQRLSSRLRQVSVDARSYGLLVEALQSGSTDINELHFVDSQGELEDAAAKGKCVAFYNQEKDDLPVEKRQELQRTWRINSRGGRITLGLPRRPMGDKLKSFIDNM